MGGCNSCEVLDTSNKGEKFIGKLCKKFPNISYCVINAKNTIPTELPQTALVVDTDLGSPTYKQGVAMLTPTGEIATLPDPIPEELVEAVPVLVDLNDIPLPPPPPPPKGTVAVASLKQKRLIDEIREVKLDGNPEENVRPSTENEQELLLKEIRQGMALKEAGKPKCPVNFYWSNAKKECVLVEKTSFQKEMEQRNQLFNAIEARREAIAGEEEILNELENEWE